MLVGCEELRDILSNDLTNWSCGQLHECGLWWQHPSQEEEEERMVAKRDHGLDDPEDGLVVT